MDGNSHDLTGDLEALATRLRDNRPEATEIELDRIKRRAISRASAGSGRFVPKKGLFMKPRIAVTFLLAMGLLMSGTGATLAVISESGSAAQVQYPDVEPQQDEVPETLRNDPRDPGQPTGTPPIQEEQQVASAGGAELPFTGFLAIPLLVIGVLFLVGGGVMRSRTRGDQSG